MTKNGKCKCPSANKLMRDIYAYRMKCRSRIGKKRKMREDSLLQTDETKATSDTKHNSQLEKVLRLRKENAQLKAQLNKLEKTKEAQRQKATADVREAAHKKAATSRLN